MDFKIDTNTVNLNSFISPVISEDVWDKGEAAWDKLGLDLKKLREGEKKLGRKLTTDESLKVLRE